MLSIRPGKEMEGSVYLVPLLSIDGGKRGGDRLMGETTLR